jgi:hypothetical protein
MNGQPVDVKMGEWIQQGFDVFKDNALVMIVAGLLTIVIGGVPPLHPVRPDACRLDDDSVGLG